MSENSHKYSVSFERLIHRSGKSFCTGLAAVRLVPASRITQLGELNNSLCTQASKGVTWSSLTPKGGEAEAVPAATTETKVPSPTARSRAVGGRRILDGGREAVAASSVFGHL